MWATSSRPVLVVKPTSGLCNRLRVISSFSCLAQRSGRDLLVCWAPGRGWSDEDLGDLFTNDVARVDEATFAGLEDDALRMQELFREVPGRYGRRYREAVGGGFSQVFDVSSFPVVTYEGNLCCEWLLPPHERKAVLPGIVSDFEARMRTWKPVPALQRVVDGLASRFNSSTMGVHIRRGDALASRASPEFRRSTDTAFQEMMDQFARSRPDAQFYLATDCAETQERFTRRYGDAVLVNADKRFVPSVIGGPKPNQADAVIDLFALSRTQRVLGTNYSSFSGLAAVIGGIPMTVAIDRPFIDWSIRAPIIHLNNLLTRRRRRWRDR